MSDEIKTQHGTVGLLMAECEQLRRDLAQAKAELQECRRKSSEIALLRSQLSEDVSLQLAQAKAENQRLTEQLESHAWEVSPAMAQAKIDQLQVENARLAAALKVIEESKFIAGTKLRLQCSDALSGNSTALRDLLAPTIELFESMQDSGCSRRVQEELSRLRSILTSSSKSDTNTP